LKPGVFNFRIALRKVNYLIGGTHFAIAGVLSCPCPGTIPDRLCTAGIFGQECDAANANESPMKPTAKFWKCLLPISLFTVLSVLYQSRAAGADGLPPEPVTLSNGLRILMRERHTTPLIAVSLWVRAGAREERAGENGCAHFLEHTLFKGTKTRGVGEVDTAIETLGGSLDAATGPDYACYSTTVPTAHLAEALAILADVVRNATLPAEEIDRERNVILDELALHEDSGMARTIDLLYAQAFPTHPYRFAPGGESPNIRTLTHGALSSFYIRCYTPARCTLVLVGDLSAASAQSAAEAAFGSWRMNDQKSSEQKPSEIENGMVGVSTALPAEIPGAVLIKARTPAAHLVREPANAHDINEQTSSSSQTGVGGAGIGFIAPPASDFAGSCAAQIIAMLLGDRSGGRLSDKSLTGTAAAAQFTPRRDNGLLLITAHPAATTSATLSQAPPALPASAPDAGSSTEIDSLGNRLDAVLARLRAQPPNASEIGAARRRLLARMEYEQETNAGLARAVGYADITGGEAPELLRRRLLHITASEIIAVMKRILTPENSVRAHLIPVFNSASGASAKHSVGADTKDSDTAPR